VEGRPYVLGGSGIDHRHCRLGHPLQHDYSGKQVFVDVQLGYQGNSKRRPQGALEDTQQGPVWWSLVVLGASGRTPPFGDVLSLSELDLGDRLVVAEVG
jgi:hypothetical protein